MRIRSLLAIGASALLLAACGDRDADDTVVNETEERMDELQREVDAASDRMDMAMAEVEMMEKTYSVLNSSGFEIGTVTIEDEDDGVELELDLTSIPEGPHAIHFHEVGRCDGPDFTSAGGHYNPSGVNHGFEASDPNPHAGDMRNFDAPQSGVVKTEIDNERVSLSARAGFAPLMDSDGTALIIHAGADDYESQPSGDAGGRIACAVIN